MFITCGYEFTYLRNVLNFKSVFARKSRKVMKAILEDFNIEFRCSLYLSQVKLERLSSVYQLNVEKQVGLLDYNEPRSPITDLTENELKYCEYDCLVLYEYIKLMREKFGTVKNIPLTSTGIVRRELKEELAKDKRYKYVVRNCLNTEGEIYDVLVSSFYGGYTHANFIYTGDIIKNVTSYDFCSSYPFVLCTEKYPMSKFRKCRIDNHTQFSSRFCYIVDITFYNIESKYFNNIISKSSCYSGDKIQTDNGRIIKAKEISTIITDIDFELIRKAYKYEYYIINECYYARKDYLPKTIVEFILKKYVDKTKLKNVEGKEVLYQITKGSFNAIYGMCCTNNIRDQVNFDNITGWSEEDLSPTQIEKLLIKEKMFPFLSFAWR